LLASWKQGRARLVVLDRVGDDHNLGSIARSAAFFGWTAIVTGLDDGAARLTTSAYRVARGALERIPVYSDESTARFVARCGSGIATIGADHRGSYSLSAMSAARSGGNALIPGWPDTSLALVLGNEETGLSPAVRTACSILVRIEGAGLVESLNVSQAAAVLLYEFGC
jgi:TrmH RNA methyltransferase